MIVAYDYYTLSVIKTFDDICDLLTYFNFDVEEGSDIITNFNEYNFYFNVMPHKNYMIIWELDNNDYTYTHICRFKKTKWYINHLRYKKLNRIIKQ